MRIQPGGGYDHNGCSLKRILRKRTCHGIGRSSNNSGRSGYGGVAPQKRILRLHQDEQGKGEALSRC